LASCADARRELEDLRRLRKTLLSLPEPALPKDLHGKIMGRVTGKLKPLRPHKPFLNFPLAGLAVAACLVLYLLVGNPETGRLELPAKEKAPEMKGQERPVDGKTLDAVKRTMANVSIQTTPVGAS